MEKYALYLLAFIFIICNTAAGETMGNTSKIKIMTFNIWHDGNAGRQPLSQTAKVIQAAKADIVGLQEVRKNAKTIADILGWHHLQQNGDTAVLSRFKIVGTTPKKLGVKVRLDSGRIVYVFNVHLMHAPYQPYQLLSIPYYGAPDLKTEEEAIAAATKARGHQLAAVLKEIKEIADVNAPVFITGDFNEPSHLDWTAAAAKAGRHPIKVAYPTTTSLENAGFTDAYRFIYPDEVKKPGFTWTPTTKPDDPNDHHDRIDFVFYKGGDTKATEVKIVGADKAYSDIVIAPYPSDHRAVVASFTVSK